MATPIYNNGSRQIQTARPQVQEGWLQRLGRKLGVVPQAGVQRVVNRRDIYQTNATYDRRVVKGINQLVSGRQPSPVNAAKNQLDPLLLEFCKNVSTNGIS